MQYINDTPQPIALAAVRNSPTGGNTKQPRFLAHTATDRQLVSDAKAVGPSLRLPAADHRSAVWLGSGVRISGRRPSSWDASVVRAVCVCRNVSAGWMAKPAGNTGGSLFCGGEDAEVRAVSPLLSPATVVTTTQDTRPGVRHVHHHPRSFVECGLRRGGRYRPVILQKKKK